MTSGDMTRKRLQGKEPYSRIYASAKDHPKHITAGLEAEGLWKRAMAYCADHLTDGKVPVAWLEAQGGKRPVRAGIKAGLFELQGDVYLVVDYLDHNPSREQVESRRAKERGKKAGIPRGNTRGNDDGDCPGEHPGEGSGDSSRLSYSVTQGESPTDSVEPVRLDPLRPVVNRLFAYWQERCRHPQAKLTSERRRKCEGRLREGYTEQDCRAAIDGAAVRPFVNDQGKRFDDFELIFRNGTKLEDFRDRVAAGAVESPADRVRREMREAAERTERKLGGAA